MIYVQPFPATGAHYQLPAKEAADVPHHPRWSPDGKELFYNPGPGGFEVVRVTTQPTFAFGNSVSLVKSLQFGPPNSRTPYDITPDGKLLGVTPAGPAASPTPAAPQIQVVLNWFEDLKMRVPGR